MKESLKNEKIEVKAEKSPPPRKELNDNPVKLCCEIARLFRSKMRECDELDGVMTQHGAHLVMAILSSADGINQLELVRRTHLSAPTVSVILKRMEAEELVTRESDPDDLRSIKVYLTEKGRALDEKNIGNIKKIDALALCDVSDVEIDLLMRLLPKLRDNLLCDKSETSGKEKTENEKNS